jgi:DNA-binding CsgD family transcriptional regulator
MSDKQQGEVVANPVAYEQLLSHLLHVGETLLGETHGVFDRLAQEVALITHGQVQLVLHQENAEQPPPPPSRFRFLIFFNNRFYGALLIEPDPADPVSPVIPLETVTMLTQACGWLLYTIEVAALLPELRQSYAQTHKARASLPEGEAAVLALMCQGYTTKKTATRLHIVPATVRKYRERIYRRLDVHSEREAVFAAFATGLFYPVADLRPRILSPTNGQ